MGSTSKFELAPFGANLTPASNSPREGSPSEMPFTIRSVTGAGTTSTLGARRPGGSSGDSLAANSWYVGDFVCAAIKYRR